VSPDSHPSLHFAAADNALMTRPLPPLRWDLFCRVIDNHGDLGVCWRLARDLASRGHAVRLWVDDASALAWMAPQGAAGVQVLPWREPRADEHPGDVVIEAFGCNPPEGFVRAMRAHGRCVWINMEYLSAEAYVERSHGLVSPQFSGPGAGLKKWFYYPGFSASTGGLLREPSLLTEQIAFNAAAVWAELGLPPSSALQVSVFAYAHSPVHELLALLSWQPCRLLACPGPNQQALIDAAAAFPNVTVVPLPWLTQPTYDRLLSACDLNFVRGEDSFVRAQWAGQPFVWQIYQQDDGAHATKLKAFLQRYLADTPAELAAAIHQLWAAWNALGPWPEGLPPRQAWIDQAQHWRGLQADHQDLVSQLQGFVADRR